MKTKKLARMLVKLLFVLVNHSIHSPTKESAQTSRPSIKYCAYLTLTQFQPPPPQLLASGLFNSCLVPLPHSGPLLQSYESFLPAPPRSPHTHISLLHTPPPLPSSQPLCQWPCKSPEAGTAKRSSCLNRSAVGAGSQQG